MSYDDYLKSAEWAQCRRDHYRMRRRNRRCFVCAATRDLCVHHRSYRHAGKGEERAHELVTLCKTCHGKLHETTSSHSPNLWHAHTAMRQAWTMAHPIRRNENEIDALERRWHQVRCDLLLLGFDADRLSMVCMSQGCEDALAALDASKETLSYADPEEPALTAVPRDEVPTPDFGFRPINPGSEPIDE